MNYSERLARLAEVPAPLQTQSRHTLSVAFDLRQGIERDYQNAYDKFRTVRESMPEWGAYEKAKRNLWDGNILGALKVRDAYSVTQEAYTEAVRKLPEWKAYWQFYKQKSDFDHKHQRGKNDSYRKTA